MPGSLPLLLRLSLLISTMFRPAVAPVWDQVVLQLDRTTTLDHVEALRRGPCPDHPQPPSTCVGCSRASARANSVLAGFNSVYTSGADPLPCDRLNRTTGQGLFSFAEARLSRTVKTNFKAAVLAIIAFAPEGGPIHVTRAKPWTASSEGSWLRSDRVATNCVFDVKAATEAWSESDFGRSGGVRTRDLIAPTVKTVTVPLTGGAMAYDVTGETRLALARGSGIGPGFSITPQKGQTDFTASNHCVGRFAVELRVMYERR